jgi:hypothetical protein
MRPRIVKKTLSFLAGSAALFTAAAGAQCPPADLSPSSAANGTISQPYTTVNFTSSAPGTFTFSGEDLPPGLSLSSAGVLSGTPTATGTSLSRIIATDTAGCVVTRTLPITIGGPACITLTVGQVQLLDGAAASDFCVASAAIDSEYTLIPVSTAADASTLNVSTTGVNIGATTGPPNPIAPDSLLDPLAPDRAEEAHPPRAADLPVFESPEQRAQALIPPAPHGTGAPAVDQIIDIQVAAGCTGANDFRKGRVEAISPVSTPAKPRLYMVQEVIEQPAGSGTYVPAVVGGFARQDFEVFRDAFDGLPPGMTGSASGTLGMLAMTGGRDAQIDNFGTVTDVDANGGVIVFFTRAMNELSPPASSSIVPAVFDARDLYSAASCPRSNEGEYIYMMVPDPTGVVNSNVRTLSFVFGNTTRNLMHHYTHLVNASRRLYVNSAPLEETWLDEGLAWVAEELLFFNTSVGLAPRGNIALADLTTGPNASRRVAAFNNYANPRFGGHRSFYLQNPTTSPLGGVRVGPLRRTPFAVPAANDHESRYLQDSVMGVFLRYAADRLGGSEAAFFTALTNAATTGVVNLQERIGADPNLWARDMAIASYTDDAVAGAAPEYTFPSWNYRSVFGGLGGYPLVVQPLTNNTAYTAGYGAGGGPRWLRFGIPAAQTNPGNFTLRESGTNPMPATSLTALIRTK